jgi:hypothetical protein
LFAGQARAWHFDEGYSFFVLCHTISMAKIHVGSKNVTKIQAVENVFASSDLFQHDELLPVELTVS